jgi:hypothetical protein
MHVGDMFKNASENVCTSAVLLSPDPLSPTPSIPSNMKTPEKQMILMTLSKQ